MSRRIRCNPWVCGVLALALLGAPALASAARCTTVPYVVKIHADWCGSCKAVDQVWKTIESDYAARATAVTLDVTDRAAMNASRETATRLGIDEFFSTYRARTGTIGVLDCNTLEPVVILNAERDLDAYLQAIDRAGGPS